MSFKGARKRNLRWNTFLVTMLLPNNPDIFLYCNWHRFTTKPIPPHAIFGYKLCLLKFKQVHLYWLVNTWCSNIYECIFHHVYYLWTKLSPICVTLWWITIFDVISKWPFPLGSFLVGDFQYWSNISITKVRS